MKSISKRSLVVEVWVPTRDAQDRAQGGITLVPQLGSRGFFLTADFPGSTAWHLIAPAGRDWHCTDTTGQTQALHLVDPLRPHPGLSVKLPRVSLFGDLKVDTSSLEVQREETPAASLTNRVTSH